MDTFVLLYDGNLDLDLGYLKDPWNFTINNLRSIVTELKISAGGH